MGKALLLAAFLVGTLATAAAQMPCFVTQLDGQYFGEWQSIPVFGRSTYTVNCPAIEFVFDSDGKWTGIVEPIDMVLDRWDEVQGDWQKFVWYQKANASLSGPIGAVRSKLTVLDAQKLGNGRYRLTTSNGGMFLEAIYFTIGTTDQPPYPVPYIGGSQVPRFDEARHIPYFRPTAILINGWLYFRGYMSSSGGWLNGYLYQPRPDGTEILPVVVQPVEPSEPFVMSPWNRGGTLDLPWVKIKVPKPNTLTSNRPVYLSVTGVGSTAVSGVVYDPDDPNKMFEGWN